MTCIETSNSDVVPETKFLGCQITFSTRIVYIFPKLRLYSSTSGLRGEEKE